MILFGDMAYETVLFDQYYLMFFHMLSETVALSPVLS
jgi:hypothetical protein